MASTKYIGYVGGVAVAVGVGAAIAAAGQGTANADTDNSSSGKESSASTSSDSKATKPSEATKGVNAGPKRKDSDAKPAKPLSKVKDEVDKAAAEVTETVSTVSKSLSDSLAKAAATKPTKPSAEEFEAKHVERLKDLFTPKPAAVKPDDSKAEVEPVATSDSEPATSTPGVTAPALRAAVQTEADATADTPWDPNPLRPDDPDPTDFPDEIIELRNALMAVTPEALDAFDPFIREATEQIYRGSQIVPWVNAVIPISKILPVLAPGLGSGPEGDRARQLIINELIKTTPPGSLLYYGYDIAVDLLNLEEPGAVLKDQAVAAVWDLLDPLELAHVKGESGIGQAIN